MFLSVLTLLLQSVYVLCVVGLSLYGCNALWLTFLRLHQRKIHPHQGYPAYLRPTEYQKSRYPYPTQQSDTQPSCDPDPSDAMLMPSTWPTVTVQLPIYNEKHVVLRLLRACARLRYPREKLQIQVLDDSDDATSRIIQLEVERLRRHRVQIDIVTRPTRAGFKAGALCNGLSTATGEFIAIFDADFEPTEDFLIHTLPHFFKSDNRQMGFIQTRWAHLNAEYSALTQSQALALDGHFMVEQPARQTAGYLFGFNGAGGIWRRACIEDTRVGGWQTDTLCEDLDLSYRAQLAGWRGLFLSHVTAPAEIPPQLLAFKRQQFRWAKGSIQTLRKLGSSVARANLPCFTRFQGIMHLGGYLVHPLLLLLLLITLPLALLPVEPVVPLPWLSFTSFGPPLLYAVAQQLLARRRWWRRCRYLPLLTLLGTGLSLNNSIAVVQGIVQNGGEFLRTPKFNVETTTDQWQHSIYRVPIPFVILGELLLMFYALITCLVLISQQNWWTLPFILLYAGGYGLMAGVGLWQSRPQRSHRHAHAQAVLLREQQRTRRTAIHEPLSTQGVTFPRDYAKHRARI